MYLKLGSFCCKLRDCIGSRTWAQMSIPVPHDLKSIPCHMTFNTNPPRIYGYILVRRFIYLQIVRNFCVDYLQISCCPDTMGKYDTMCTVFPCLETIWEIFLQDITCNFPAPLRIARHPALGPFSHGC